MLCENVGNNKANGGTHGCALSFLIVDSIKNEESSVEENSDALEGFRIN